MLREKGMKHERLFGFCAQGFELYLCDKEEPVLFLSKEITCYASGFRLTLLFSAFGLTVEVKPSKLIRQYPSSTLCHDKATN